MSNTHYIGKSGEYAVAAQLLMRDIPVHFPAVDDGVDLIAGGRLRIQVKTSRKHDYRLGGYVFTLSKRVPKEGHKQYWLRMPDWSELDYLVCCGIDDNRFWVIPTAAVLSAPEVQTLILGKKHHKLVDHDRLEELLQSGMSQAQVAREMDISPMCVSEHRSGKRPSGRYENNLAMLADAYENCWDHILRSLGLLSPEV